MLILFQTPQNVNIGVIFDIKSILVYKNPVEGRIQRALNGIAEYNREHQGTVAGGTVFLAGAGAAAAKVEVAPIAMAVGAITLFVSSGVDYMNNVIGRSIPRGNTLPKLPPGFHDEKTKIMSTEEVDAIRTAWENSHPPTS